MPYVGDRYFVQSSGSVGSADSANRYAASPPRQPVGAFPPAQPHAQAQGDHIGQAPANAAAYGLDPGSPEGRQMIPQYNLRQPVPAAPNPRERQPGAFRNQYQPAAALLHRFNAAAVRENMPFAAAPVTPEQAPPTRRPPADSPQTPAGRLEYNDATAPKRAE